MTNAANETNRAQADFDYFIYSGELPEHSPMTEDVAEAVEHFDGSCQAETFLWCALHTAYERMRENAAMTNEDRAQSDFEDFIYNGELPAHSPMTDDLAAAVQKYDGSCQTEKNLKACLFAAYEQTNGH